MTCLSSNEALDRVKIRNRAVFERLSADILAAARILVWVCQDHPDCIDGVLERLEADRIDGFRLVTLYDQCCGDTTAMVVRILDGELTA